MNTYVILIIIFTLIALGVLIFYINYTKLKKYNEKIIKAENIIDSNLDKKLNLIITINSEVKKVSGKKDYLKEYTSIKGLIITNIDKDLKLTEAVKLINNLANDFVKLKNDKEFNKLINELREIDEVLTSAKNIYNQNALNSNQLIKTFPSSIVAKIAKFKTRSFYTTNNKTDDKETF